MDAIYGDKWRTVWALTVAHMWRSDAYRKEFVADPKAGLKKIGVAVPDDVTVKVLEDTESITHIALPHDLELRLPAAEQYMRFFNKLFPLPEGHEVRILQSTDKTRYVVVPMKPRTMKEGELAEAELMAIAAGGTEAVTAETTEAVVAETTEATVTETTEVQDVETTTTVVAVAELVAT